MANEVRFNIRLNIDGKDKVVTATTAMDNLRQVVGDVKNAANDLKGELINTNQITEAWNNVTNTIQNFSDSLNSLTAESRNFGGAMAAANTMAGKNAEGLANLKEQVTDLAKNIPIARDELANGLYQVISNGVPEDNWIEYLDKSAKASVGGIADLGEVVKVTSTVIKNYGLEWSNAGEIQDKIQLTAKNGVTSFEQMAQALPRVTANAATLGVSIDELMASFATLTGVSGNTAEVSTQLAAIFTALIKPSSEAAEMAQQMGIQFDAAAIKAAGGLQQFLVSLNNSVRQFSASSGMLEQEIYGKLFGSAESLRAITPLVGNLADTFQRNVVGMADSAGTIDEAFETMSSTGSAALQILNNKLGEYTDILQGSIGNVVPYVNFGAQMITAGASAMTLAKNIQALSITSKLASAAIAVFGPIVQVCSATMRGATVSAETLRLAIRSLMITTGVGIAVAAITELINYLANSSSNAANAVDQLTEAQQRAKQAHEQTAQQMAAVESEMEQSMAKLKGFKGSKEQEKKLVQEMNTKYGEAMGYYGSVAQWYEALTANSKTYCQQMINEIQLRNLANRAAELRQQRQDLTHDRNGRARRFSTQNERQMVRAEKGDLGSFLVGGNYYKYVEKQGTSQLAKVTQQAQALYDEEQALKRQMEQLASHTTPAYKHTTGYSSTPPTATTPTKTTPTKTTPAKTTPTHADKPKKEEPLAGSIDWYEQQIRELQRQLSATADEDAARSLQATLEGKQRELGMLKVRIGLEKPEPIEVRQTAKGIIEQMDERLRDNPLHVKADWELKVDNLDRLNKLGSVDLSNFEGVRQTLAAIQGITDPTAQGLAAASTSCQALGTAMQQLGADSEAAKAGMIMAAVAQVALSYAQALMSAKHWTTWLAFGISGVATMTSIIATLQGFATGGIVGGNQKTGDRLMVRVNSGEMILNAAQQARLFALANGAATYGMAAQVTTDHARSMALPRVSVQTDRLRSMGDAMDSPRHIDIGLKLRGRDLVAAIANETRSNSRRSNIR